MGTINQKTTILQNLNLVVSNTADGKLNIGDGASNIVTFNVPNDGTRTPQTQKVLFHHGVVEVYIDVQSYGVNNFYIFGFEFRTPYKQYITNPQQFGWGGTKTFAVGDFQMYTSISKNFIPGGVFTKKILKITEGNKVLTLQRTISNTWIDGTNYNSARQHFKEAPSTDILFFRNLVAHGDIGNETRTNTTQQGWNGGQAIMYEHWYAYYGQQTWNHKTELSLHLNEFITEAKKHDVAEVEIMLYGRSNSKSEWYKYSTGGETHSFPITINIETGEVSIIDINGTKHIVPNDNSQINLGGWNTGNNRIEFSVWQQNGVLFMAPWIKWQNQSWVATCYFTSWRYRKYE